MNLISKLINFFTPKHKCRFDFPVLSTYSSFNGRRIIYQCKCGNKKEFLEHRAFSIPFPIQTCSGIGYKESETILNSKKILKKPIISYIDYINFSK